MVRKEGDEGKRMRRNEMEEYEREREEGDRNEGKRRRSAACEFPQTLKFKIHVSY